MDKTDVGSFKIQTHTSFRIITMRKREHHDSGKQSTFSKVKASIHLSSGHEPLQTFQYYFSVSSLKPCHPGGAWKLCVFIKSSSVQLGPSSTCDAKFLDIAIPFKLLADLRPQTPPEINSLGKSKLYGQRDYNFASGSSDVH